MNRRSFLDTAKFGLIGAATNSLSPFFSQQINANLKLIIDADTGNEIDDLYAIVRALLEPRFNLLGLTAAQYHTKPNAPKDSVGDSHRINSEILSLMSRSDLPHREGSNHPMVNQWRPQPSAAAEFIIDQATKLTADEKLSIAILGPCTNIASALLIEPAIVSKLTVYYLGFWHDLKRNTWSKREFNTNNDPNAVDALLNNPQLEFNVMTATTCQHLVFEKATVDRHLKGKGGIADYLVNRWESYDRWFSSQDKEKTKWIMWDVALIEAMAKPELAQKQLVITPHDNLERTISAYTGIDVQGMKKDYWAKLNTL